MRTPALTRMYGRLRCVCVDLPIGGRCFPVSRSIPEVGRMRCYGEHEGGRACVCNGWGDCMSVKEERFDLAASLAVIVLVVGLLALVLVACVGLFGCGGTHLEAVDQRALLNEQKASKAIIVRSDSGAIQSLAEVIFCSAGATLHRAGAPSED